MKITINALCFLGTNFLDTMEANNRFPRVCNRCTQRSIRIIVKKRVPVIDIIERCFSCLERATEKHGE